MMDMLLLVMLGDNKVSDILITLFAVPLSEKGESPLTDGVFLACAILCLLVGKLLSDSSLISTVS